MLTFVSGFHMAKTTVPAELNTTLGQPLCQRHLCCCPGPVTDGSCKVLLFHSHWLSGRKAEPITMSSEDSERLWRDEVLGGIPADLGY